jgi:hypothetical protein
MSAKFLIIDESNGIKRIINIDHILDVKFVPEDIKIGESVIAKDHLKIWFWPDECSLAFDGKDARKIFADLMILIGRENNNG